MTRYLPIRKEEFDLRSHVESSGHSVDTCYHIIITEKMCKGYLVKMGGKIKSWKKRWFVFDRLKRTLSYYVGKRTAPLSGFLFGAFILKTEPQEAAGLEIKLPEIKAEQELVTLATPRLQTSHHVQCVAPSNCLSVRDVGVASAHQ